MKKNIKNDPSINLILDEEEQLLEEALERDEFSEDAMFVDTEAMLEEAAARYLELHTSKPVTIRINQLDLIKVKARAKGKGIPYQTLLGSLIHGYAEGKAAVTL